MTNVNEESGEFRDVTSETAFEGVERTKEGRGAVR